MATGKIKTLFSNKEKTEALFPRTKISAVSDESGVGLDAILNDLNTQLDTKASEAFVSNKIAEAQIGGGGDIDLSGYATKDDVNAVSRLVGTTSVSSQISSAINKIDYPVDSVNGKTGAVTLGASDVGAAASSHNHSASNITSGTLDVARLPEIPMNKGGTGQDLSAAPKGAIIRNSIDDTGFWYTATKSGALYATAENVAPAFGTLPIAQGGTGATTAAAARTALGITPANIGAAASSHDHDSTYMKDYSGAINLNNSYNGGLYRVLGGSNCPSYSQYGTLISMPYRKFTGGTTPDYGAQIYIPCGDDRTKANSLFYRTALSDSWNAWQEVSTVGHTHDAATQSAAGLMSAADKKKLDGIATGANKYSLPNATSSTLGGVKVGSNITVSSGTISLTKANVTSALGYTPPTSASAGISREFNSGALNIASGTDWTYNGNSSKIYIVTVKVDSLPKSIVFDYMDVQDAGNNRKLYIKRTADANGHANVQMQISGNKVTFTPTDCTLTHVCGYY